MTISRIVEKVTTREITEYQCDFEGCERWVEDVKGSICLKCDTTHCTEHKKWCKCLRCSVCGIRKAIGIDGYESECRICYSDLQRLVEEHRRDMERLVYTALMGGDESDGYRLAAVCDALEEWPE